MSWPTASAWIDVPCADGSGRTGGRDRAGLRARPASSRPPKLTAAQRKQLARLVVAGPEAAGYATSRWTCRRIVDVIRQQFKVIYHPDHVGRLLRSFFRHSALAFSCLE
jgi:transposase